MTFAEFVAAVDERVKAYGVRRMVDQEDRDTHAGWTDALHAQLFSHPEDFHYPVYLGSRTSALKVLR